MRFSRPFVRFTCCFLSYVLLASFIVPPSLRATANNAVAPLKAGKTARVVESTRARVDAPSREGELLVRFREDVSEQGREGLAASRGARRKGKLRGDSRLEKFTLRQGQNPAAVADQLRNEPGVELVEPNFLVTRAQVVPNDPRFDEQWALRNTGQAGGVPGSDIGVSNAWGTTTGLQSAVVAVIDSGVDFTHPDLSNNRWVNAREKENNKDDDRNGFVNDLNGWDWVTDSGVIRDENGHGTAVAGIIAAQGDNDAGVSGVMWRASVMSLRVLDAGGTGNVADAVEAIDYAAEMGAQVINCSWGTDGESLILRDAIERAGRRGVVVVASVGNGSRDLDTQPYYPAAFDLPNVLAVASSDQFDNLAQFSNWGATRVALTAPGTDILTTKMGGDYRLMSGTSFSAPLVAGVVGLVKTQRPGLSAAAAKQVVLDGARRVNTLAGKVASGGVVSASGALSKLTGPSDSPGNGGGDNGDGNGDGNGNGQGGRPSDPGRGRGDNKGQAPPATPTAPTGGPDLNQLRNEESYVPQAPPPQGISANAPPVCEDCYEAAGSDPQFAQSRSQLANETGEPGVDLGSRNYNWSLPLLDLPGRAGLDLSLSLNYNSLVWTKQGNAFQFDADGGYPSPGFSLGFPQLQKQFTDGNGITAYMMVMPSGGRITMRYTAVNVYEDRDGSYAQLQILSGNWARVTMTNGTQYTFEPKANGEKRCREIKDRNGNFISINYDGAGRVSTATDTLGRVVNFIYSGNGQLYQLTQSRGGSGHTDLLAQFGYADLYMSPYFTDANGNQLSTLGPNGASISVLTQVWLPDGISYGFGYTLYGQVYKIAKYAADSHVLNYEWYNLSSSPDVGHSAQQECPRFTERRDWVEYGVMQQSQAVSTFYSTNAANTETQVTLPDGTVYKEFFAPANTGVKEGLPTGSEVWSGGVKKKWTTKTWSYATGGVPQLSQSTVEDAEGNRRRTTIEYNQGYGLPTHIRQYAGPAGQDVMLRFTAFNYNLDSAYVNRRIIGLPGERITYDTANGNVISKEWYMYDWGAPYFDTQAPSIQHDGINYSSSFVAGRGNLVAVYRYSCQGNNQLCDSGGQVWSARTGYNVAGSKVWEMDALGHQTNVSYADSYSDTSKNNLGTLAYPTSITDAENYTSTVKYDYTTGAPTEMRRPSSGTNALSNVTYETHNYEYDWAARFTKDSTQNNGFYTRWEYPADGGSVKSFQNIRPDLYENYSVKILDGAGRTRRTASYMPGSTTHYSGRQFNYDAMGRLVQWTNPTDTTGDANWTASGDDATAGWLSTSRTYDWQGRPRVTTYPDSTTTELTYGGCGCAGGEVVTARDQRGRLKKVYHDVLGRMSKVEELDYNSAVYSTAVYTYNARDQITKIRHHQGTSGTYQDRTFGYDGHGRVSTRTTPEQGTTNYTYYDDDTMHVMTDARGASQTFGYTARHLVSSIEFNSVSGVTPTTNVYHVYDAAGNRTQMTDGVGVASYHYDSLSRMDWEQRTFAGLSSTFTTTYSHNNVGLASVTNPSEIGGSRVDYTVDHTGTTSSVTGSGSWSASTYVQGLQYRAFGGATAASYGNGRTLSVTYNNMLRIDTWGVSGVTGWKYYYNDFGENTGRVTYAQNTYNVQPGQTGGADPTLDRSYDYDLVGRLYNSYTGAEAKAHTGRSGGQWGVYDGPYSQAYVRDVWGNVTQKMGRSGDPDQFTATYTNNRRDGFTYDAAGNLKFDGGQNFSYDATGQQTYVDWTNLSQFYDGDRLRVKKTEGGSNTPTYYLRSTMLGGQILAEINPSGGLQRGFVYGAGGGLLAIQTTSGVNWVYQDAATKSQRLTDSSGNVTAAVDLDPWGRETARSWSSQQQPRRYTTYTRDTNESDEAMMRRYNRWHLRFDQPDPTDGSYNLINPQSFNRYAYANNDPVNLIDPSGLLPNLFQYTYGSDHGISGFGGWGTGWGDINDRPRAGREIIREGEERSEPFFRWVSYWWEETERVEDFPYVSMFNTSPFSGASNLQGQVPTKEQIDKYLACVKKGAKRLATDYANEVSQDVADYALAFTFDVLVTAIIVGITAPLGHEEIAAPVLVLGTVGAVGIGLMGLKSWSENNDRLKTGMQRLDEDCRESAGLPPDGKFW